MEARTLRVRIEEDGQLLLRDLPLQRGEEVLIRLESAPQAREEATPKSSRGSLRGTVRGYDDPFGPACPESDWDTPLD